MSVLEKGLKKAGLKLQADTLPKEQRTVKCFQRLIAAVRATEAELTDQLNDAQRQLNEQLQENLAMHKEIEVLRAKLVHQQLKEGLGQIEALTVNDRCKLLELSQPAKNGG